MYIYIYCIYNIAIYIYIYIIFYDNVLSHQLHSSTFLVYMFWIVLNCEMRGLESTSVRECYLISGSELPVNCRVDFNRCIFVC